MEEKKHSLWDLQNLLMQAEEEAKEGDLELIVGKIADKVDSIKEVIDMLESEADRFKKYKDEMAARQKSLQNASERLKKYVLKCLNDHGTSFETGNVWVIKKKETKAVELLTEPSLDLYLKLAEKNPMQSYLKQSYSFDKREIATALKLGNSELEGIAKLTTNQSISFSTVNKAKK